MARGDRSLVRYIPAVGNNRWPGTLSPLVAEVGPVPAALRSDMVVSVGSHPHHLGRDRLLAKPGLAVQHDHWPVTGVFRVSGLAS
jgi:hypothetical protein